MSQEPKKLTIGWHGDLYWSGLLWYTRQKRINGVKCVGSGRTPEEAQSDLLQQQVKAEVK